MEHTKDLQQVIDEVHERNMKVTRDGKAEKAYHDKMMKLYDRYIEDNDRATRMYKIKTCIFLGVLITVYIAYFAWRAAT